MNFPARKSPRIPNYDYSSENYYFITICTHEKKCVFGLPENRTALGALAQRHLLNIENHYSGVEVEKFVVMPNHIHMILVLHSEGKENAVQIIGQYKSGVTRQVRKQFPDIQLWQRSFHDHVIRNQADYERIWTYIENNPYCWSEDCFYVDQIV